jgi:CRISPR-associated protein Csd2
MSEEQRKKDLQHKLIDLPRGKSAEDIVCERHDLVLLFDATKANPNGDPDTGNMPRLQPDTLRGLVTDVCLKRKVRNFFSRYLPDSTLRNGSPSPGYEIFIRENAILQELMESPEIEKSAKDIFIKGGFTDAQWSGKAPKGKTRGKGKGKAKVKQPEKAPEPAPEAIQHAVSQSTENSAGQTSSPVKPSRDIKDARDRAYRDALCRSFFDVRAFGGVAATEGPLKGSFYGQIRGPLQFTFSESLDRVLQLDATITRCAVASEKEKKEAQAGEDGEDVDAGNRTMGRKHVVNYALYRTHIYFSPAFAAKTGFTYFDLDNFLFALIHMFRDDSAAGRAGMRVVGLVDFQHSSALGNDHSHKLFDMVCVNRTEESLKRDFPESLTDYCGVAPQGTVRDAGDTDGKTALVTAKKLVWEIPPCPRAVALEKTGGT